MMPRHVLNPRPRLSLPLVLTTLSLWSFGCALAMSGGGFGGTSSSVGPTSSSSSSSSSFGTSSSIWGPSPSSTGSSSSSSGESWTLEEVLFVLGLFVAYLLIASLIEWWKARRLAPGAVRVQLLFSNGAEVKEQLQKLARRHDPDRPGALSRLLRESALLLLRHKDDWTYGTLERRRVGDVSRAGNVVGEWATRARAAFEKQTTSQYQDGDVSGGLEQDTNHQGKRGGTYLAVTLAASTVNTTYPGLGGTPGTMWRPPCSRWLTWTPITWAAWRSCGALTPRVSFSWRTTPSCDTRPSRGCDGPLEDSPGGV